MAAERPNEYIIARLHGGLGNQLFVYAAARQIAAARGTRLLLDGTSAFVRDRKYGAICQLQHFAAAAPFAPPELCFENQIARWRRDIENGISEHVALRHRFVVREKDFGELCSGGALRRTVRLEGYWQSERYFAPIADQIRRELTVTSPLSVASRDMLARIGDCEAVCVHIRQRRGAPHAPSLPPPPRFAQLPYTYYEKAVALIAQKVARPIFFCFGDNPDWLRERWNFPYPALFVEHNQSQERAYEDLALMTRCRHFIIGNSTFSWWGAWLADAGKIVVAPSNEGPLKWASEPDVSPSGWTVLRNE